MRIRLEHVSPPVGEAGVVGNGVAQRFVGWLDLLRVLADIFGSQEEEHDER